MNGPEPARPLDPRDLDGESDPDLGSEDRLLGVPASDLLTLEAFRGAAMALVALAIVVWPDRTDKVAAVLVGAAMAIYAVTTSYTLVRRPNRRGFPLIMSVAVTGGLSAALLSKPSTSLTSVIQTVGIAAIAFGLYQVFSMLWRRSITVHGAVTSTGLGLGGALLMLFPLTLMAAATSAAAGLLFAVGLLQIFATQPHADSSATNGHGGPASEPAERAATKAAVFGAGLPGMLSRWIQGRPDTLEDRGTLREKVVFEGGDAPVRFARFSTLMFLASVIAAGGVVAESTAVVIGAMLVAPLMVPLMGTALSLTMGWPAALRRCATVSLSGIGIAVATGAVIGAILPRTVDVQSNTEILSRISPTALDLAIAVAAGAAGAYALARQDVSDALPGVAVAISLVPPLAVVGLCWEQGAFSAGNGALLLFLTNATAILIVGGLTFVLVGAVPLQRISASQQRVSTALMGLLAVASVVLLLLLLNGSTLARADLNRAQIDETLAAYTKDHPSFEVAGQQVSSDGTISIDLVGPGRPPDLDALLEELQGEISSDGAVRVTWVNRQQVEADGIRG